MRYQLQVLTHRICLISWELLLNWNWLKLRLSLQISITSLERPEYRLYYIVELGYLKIRKRAGGLNKACIENAVMVKNRLRRKKIPKRIKIQSLHSGKVLLIFSKKHYMSHIIWSKYDEQGYIWWMEHIYTTDYSL